MTMVLFKSMIAYIRFFTRIYIPGNLDDEVYYLNKGSKFLPLFGLLIGGVEGGVYYALQSFLSPTLTIILILLLDACLTGAMHQDGFADLCDGLFSSRKPERMLEIMKDSRLGTMGALALIFYYVFVVAIFSSYASLLQGLAGSLVILSMNMLGKSNIIFLCYKMRYKNANNNGLGQIWSGLATYEIVIAQLISLVLLGLIYGELGIVIFIVQIVFLIIYRRFIYKRIGGFNGDALGGVVPVTNILFLFSVCLLRTYL